MGLDTVEILVQVEDTFGIKIPDKEAEKIITVGDFHNAVWRHLAGKYNDRCHSQMLFYKIRRSVSEQFNFPNKEFVLTAAPNDVFPREDRRRQYLSFEKSSGLELPELSLTKPWLAGLSSFGWLTILGGLLFSLVLINVYDASKWTLLFPVIGILLTIFISTLLDPYRTVITDPTIRDFVHRVMNLNYKKLMTDNGVNRIEMEAVINYIISEKSGLDLSEITADKMIGDDLGIN